MYESLKADNSGGIWVEVNTLKIEKTLLANFKKLYVIEFESKTKKQEKLGLDVRVVVHNPAEVIWKISTLFGWSLFRTDNLNVVICETGL